MSQDVIADHVSGNIPLFTSPPAEKSKRLRKKTNFWPEAPYNAAREEESLWCAVITQAVMDACNNSPDPDWMVIKKNAILWLTGNSEDFIDVCIAAGLDPEHVRKQAKKTLLHPTMWRAEAGCGYRFEYKRQWRKRRKTLRKTAPRNETPAGACIIVYPFN